MNNIKLRAIIFFIISCFIFYNFPEENYSVMYVHLGNKLPEYIYDSIVQTRLFNPKTTIYIICYRELENKIKESLKNISNVQLIISQDLDISKEHNHFLNVINRTDFWQFSSERFFYIEQAMKKYNLNNIFHLENDNLLYINLGEYINIFSKKYPGIGATFDNDNRCIAGFMFIKNIESINALNHTFAELAEYNYNDMEILAIFKKKNPKLIDNLPIIPGSYKTFFSLKNQLGDFTSSSNSYSNNFELFESIFDAAALGQYLGGIDPIHRNSKPGFVNERCLFNPANFSYAWMLDKQERKVPVIIFKNQMFKINNLHIHCKNLKKFMS